MAATTPQKFTLSGGPVIDIEVDNTANSYVDGSVMSFSSGKAVPAAADATFVGLVVGSYIKDDLTYVRLDVGGAIARNVAFTSATAVTSVEWSDNHTVAAVTNEGDHGGTSFRVVSTNVADVILPALGNAVPTAVV
jgi:hypothetical protein